MPHQPSDTHLWQVDALGGLELIRADLAAFAFTPHAHAEYFVAVTEGGSGSPRFWGELQQLGRGDVFVLNPGEVHRGGPADGARWRYRGFYPPAALMRRAARELTGRDGGVPRFPHDVFDDPAVASLLRRAHAAFEGRASALERESRLLDALAALIERHATGGLTAGRVGREHHAVRRARDVLDAHPADNLSLDRLADEAGLRPYHLCRVFRRETGLPPHAYQIMMRLRLAKRLLADGTPISQAAVEAGFFDQAHLTRHFKRVYGVTLGRYAG